MSRVNVQDLEAIEGSNVDWFQLRNDGDTARVQFVMDKYDDIQVFMVHKVKPNGAQYDVKVDCLRNYNDPLDKCPLCEAGIKTSASKFIGLYDKSDKKVKLWERGSRFIKVLKPYCDRYKPLRNYVFDIQRNGAVGSRDTTYNIFPVPDEQGDDISVLTYDALGVGVREWTPQEMKEYLRTGNGPGSDENNNQSNTTPQPVRRDRSVQTDGDYSEVF